MTHRAEVNRLQNSLSRRGYEKPAVDPIQDAVVISEKVQRSSCFGAAVSAALLLVAAIVGVLGGAL